MSSGLLQKFEDFCPISETQALIAHGPNYPSLNEVLVVDYYGDEGRVKISKSREYGISGTFIRLGNIYDGKLVYSDGWSVLREGDTTQLFRGLQPYATEHGIYYQRKNKIFLNGNMILPLMVDFIEMGRPTIYENYMYYEANPTKDSPKTWEIWKMNLGTKEKEMVIPGANPYVYNNILFYSFWTGMEYELRYVEL